MAEPPRRGILGFPALKCGEEVNDNSYKLQYKGERKMSERNETWVLYPEYFDTRLSRRMGRKAPLSYSVENPTLEELIEATRKTGLRIVRIERDKIHPANWIEKKGRIVIPKIDKKSKRKILMQIGKTLKIVRKKNIEKRKLEEKKKTKKRDIDKYLQRILKEKKKGEKK